MNNLKKYFWLLLSMGNVFMLGAYTDAVVNGHKDVKVTQWIISSVFAILFLTLFTNKNK